MQRFKDYGVIALVSVLLSGHCLPIRASNLSTTEITTIFSSWMVYPESGDCGGWTLTLVQNDKLSVIRGYLQSYKGNCEDTKVPITNVRFDKAKHALSFTAPVYVQDGASGLVIAGEYRFSGTVTKHRVQGTVKYCFADRKSCNAQEPIALRAVDRETP